MHDLRRVIGFSSGTALIVGITIGSGIFRTPPTVAGLVPSPLVIMALWVAFGLISICGALTVAELSSMLPRTGGVYVFLREALYQHREFARRRVPAASSARPSGVRHSARVHSTLVHAVESLSGPYGKDHLDPARDCDELKEGLLPLRQAIASASADSRAATAKVIDDLLARCQ